MSLITNHNLYISIFAESFISRSFFSRLWLGSNFFHDCFYTGIFGRFFFFIYKFFARKAVNIDRYFIF